MLTNGGKTMRARTALIASCLLVGAFLPTAADASSPVGVCPSDYVSMTKKDVKKLPDADLALAVFDAVDANGDGTVCYRPYPNGSHNGHYGNFVDNTAAPHQ
jgi:hypothetical protein